jgi:hypothetical protein
VPPEPLHGTVCQVTLLSRAGLFTQKVEQVLLSKATVPARCLKNAHKPFVCPEAQGYLVDSYQFRGFTQREPWMS